MDLSKTVPQLITLLFLYTIQQLYFKRFKKEQPDRVVSLEEQGQEIQRKKEEKKATKLARQASEDNQSEKENGNPFS